ncbi:alanyl-tRNA synthetase, putative [Talaromyces stipitatus ATCC 10500]|uniref:Alanyl-tRNA synthetase, putative n=1 Tax=Talaromyces stipitatus (strain ATCC 10500 / CBS 375.48 / QM 6759 / NRRL 1006) TaxID=441959 RepID=B8MHZ5_TALSN|nr:alanyl-tRNA synthetase, putative [Talaromyces stipitatus ATCC 10500]EED17157.1 alanyl-tRNA synthetase, putative [Talaromyces stipitatus ATCC 10500]
MAPPCQAKGVGDSFDQWRMKIYAVKFIPAYWYSTFYLSPSVLLPCPLDPMASTTRTSLVFQHDAKLNQLETTVILVRPFGDIEELNRQTFKIGGNEDYVVVTEKTIFHPQGGGQPCDVGSMIGSTGLIFTVTAVRMDAVYDGQVMHLGNFKSEDAASSVKTFNSGENIQQAIDVDKRLLYSRLHTAGHVLGASVRHLVKNEVKDFAELKASHFPGAAACEFQGLIDGKWKDAIQQKVDDSIAAKLLVSVEWWDENEFRRRGLDYMIPDSSLVAPGEKFRVVNIAGLDVYPCGGTHVETTDLCGRTTVRKITRKQGQSKISYSVD